MNKKILVGIVILGLVGVFFLMPAYVGMNDKKMSIQWRNEEGEDVYVPPSLFGFRAGDQPVSEFTVTLGYEVTHGGELDTLEVGGSVTVRVDVTGVGQVYTNTWAAFQGDTALTGSKSNTWSLSSMITSIGDEEKEHGWTITVTGNLQIDGYVDGQLRTDSWSDSVSYTLSWVDSEFTVTGSIGGSLV